MKVINALASLLRCPIGGVVVSKDSVKCPQLDRLQFTPQSIHLWSKQCSLMKLASNVQKKDMMPNCRTCIPFRAQGRGKLCTSTLYRLWFLKVILKKMGKIQMQLPKECRHKLIAPFSIFPFFFPLREACGSSCTLLHI